MNINRIIVSGRLAKDPEVKDINPSLSVCRMSIVTEHKYKGKDGQETKEVCFHECSVWNKQAERCAATLKKGSLVTVEGRLKMEKWVDKATAVERSKHVIAVDTIIFMEPKEEYQPVQKQFEAGDELPF